jgi:hypothetical protein
LRKKTNPPKTKFDAGARLFYNNDNMEQDEIKKGFEQLAAVIQENTALFNIEIAKLGETTKQLGEEIENILTATNAFSTQVEQRFDSIETKMVTKDDLKREFDGFRMQMATKPYLDDKLADVRADSGRLLRKEDSKVNAVIDNLENKEIINEEESQALINLGPFIQTSISTSQ